MDNLLTHSSTKEDLQRILVSLPHAIGLQGEPASGKKHVSKYIAGRILGVGDVNSYPYFLSVDCNQKVGIEEIRDSRKFLALKIPGDKNYKRCLAFWSFQSLGHEAQNALLKSIEEPPKDTLIIITTDSKNNLLPTIVSRLSWISVRPVSMEESLEYFSSSYDKNKIEKAHMLSGGAAGMLSELLEDYDNHYLVQSVNEVKDLLNKHRVDRLSLADKLSKDREFDMDLFLGSLSKIFSAALRSGLSRTGRADPKLLADLKKITEAQNSKNYNANQKLIVTDLLYNL